MNNLCTQLLRDYKQFWFSTLKIDEIWNFVIFVIKSVTQFPFINKVCFLKCPTTQQINHGVEIGVLVEY